MEAHAITLADFPKLNESFEEVMEELGRIVQQNSDMKSAKITITVSFNKELLCFTSGLSMDIKNHKSNLACDELIAIRENGELKVQPVKQEDLFAHARQVLKDAGATVTVGGAK